MPAYRGIYVSDPVSFTASLGTESVTFVFDRSKQTLRRERDLRRAGEANDVDGLVKELMEILVSWDVVDEAGEPVPLSADILLDLPGPALGNLLELMGKAGQPADAEGEASSVPSLEPSTTSSATPPQLQN